MLAAQGVAGGVANPFLQMPQFYQSPYGAMYANQLQQWYYNYYRLETVNEEATSIPPKSVDSIGMVDLLVSDNNLTCLLFRCRDHLLLAIIGFGSDT
jgi:hypothetical protein